MRDAGQQTGLRPGCKVLIVDDMRDTRDLLSIALTRAGFEVVTVGNCMDALATIDRERVAGRQVDAAVLDCAMPIMDGMTCAQEIRLNERMYEPGYRPVRIAFYTAKERDVDLRRIFTEVGAEKDFRKPHDAAELPRLITEWLSNDC